MDRRNDNQDERRPRGERWVIDRKIPIALIYSMAIFLIGQTTTIVWWVATTQATNDGRLTQIETHLEKESTANSNAKVIERLAVLETLTAQIAKATDNMDRRLEAFSRERRP